MSAVAGQSRSQPSHLLLLRRAGLDEGTKLKKKNRTEEQMGMIEVKFDKLAVEFPITVFAFRFLQILRPLKFYEMGVIFVIYRVHIYQVLLKYYFRCLVWFTRGGKSDIQQYSSRRSSERLDEVPIKFLRPVGKRTTDEVVRVVATRLVC